MKKLMLNYIIDETKSNLRLYRVEILTPFLGLHESDETMIRMKPDSKHGFYIYGEIFCRIQWHILTLVYQSI